MGFYIQRRRKIGKRSHVNASKSGISVSHGIGRVTVNSRGRAYVRGPFGIRWRGKL